MMHKQGSDMNNIAYIGLGTNIGDRECALRVALTELNCHSSIQITAVSNLYETDPVGYRDQPDFLNMTARLVTSLAAEGLLEQMLRVETQLGRVRQIRNGPRVIDLDLLWVEGVQSKTPYLTLPHPRMFERAFVMMPLADIVPASHKKVYAFVHEFLKSITGTEGVRKWKRPNWLNEFELSESLKG